MGRPVSVYTQLKNLKVGTYANIVFYTLEELLEQKNVSFDEGNLKSTARNSMPLNCSDFKMLDIHSGFIQNNYNSDSITLNVKDSDGDESETKIYFNWHWLVKSAETFDYASIDSCEFDFFDEEVVIYEDGFLKAGCRDVSSDDFELMMVEWSKITGREVTIAEEA